MVKVGPRLGFLVAALALSALVAAACGGDDNAPAKATTAPTTAAPTATPTPAAQVIQLKPVEDGQKYSFDPATITVKAGEVTIRYSNAATNARAHTFEIKTLAGDGDIVKSAQVQPGTEADIKFTIQDAGTYQFICYQQGHVARGQVGTLVVTKP